MLATKRGARECDKHVSSDERERQMRRLQTTMNACLTLVNALMSVSPNFLSPSNIPLNLLSISARKHHTHTRLAWLHGAHHGTHRHPAPPMSHSWRCHLECLISNIRSSNGRTLYNAHGSRGCKRLDQCRPPWMPRYQAARPSLQ